MFSDEVLLARLEECAVYADHKSFEEKTGKVKLKYKLFCSKIKSLGIYLFLVGESNHAYCELDITLWVRFDEWEDKNPKYLNAISYFDLSKSESLNDTEIINKTRDTYNKFPRVAYLPNNKHLDLQQLIKNSERKHYKKKIVKTPNLVKAIFKDDAIANSILVGLGL